MAFKVYLSPSNQIGNKYAYGNTSEAIQCEQIAAFCATALKRCGIQVMVSKRNQTMATRVANSKTFGADLHVPIHTNAYNGNVMGTRVFYYSSTSKGFKAAQAVYSVLAPLSPGRADAMKPYPALYEIKNSDAPAVYCECEFHDSVEGAKWIIANKEKIAEAICKGICNYAGITYVSPVTPTPDPKPSTSYVTVNLPMVRSGSRDDATLAVQQLLNAKGYNCGTADGEYGPNTANGIKKFQAAKKLTADGVVGKDTWTAMLGGKK